MLINELYFMRTRERRERERCTELERCRLISEGRGGASAAQRTKSRPLLRAIRRMAFVFSQPAVDDGPM